MTAMRLRSSLPGTVRTSTPSMMMRPEAGSTSRSSACISVLLPQPDLPTTPSLQPAPSAKLTPRSTSGSPSL